MKCNYEWYMKPGPVTCPECGHLYVEWINYWEVDWLNRKNKI